MTGRINPDRSSLAVRERITFVWAANRHALLEIVFLHIYKYAYAQPACVVTVFSLFTGPAMPPGSFLLVSCLTNLLADDTFPDPTAISFQRTHSFSHEKFVFFLQVLNHPAAATLLTYSEGSKDRMCAEAISVALLNTNCCYHSLGSL